MTTAGGNTRELHCSRLSCFWRLEVSSLDSRVRGTSWPGLKWANRGGRSPKDGVSRVVSSKHRRPDSFLLGRQAHPWRGLGWTRGGRIPAPDLFDAFWGLHDARSWDELVSRELRLSSTNTTPVLLPELLPTRPRTKRSLGPIWFHFLSVLLHSLLLLVVVINNLASPAAYLSCARAKLAERRRQDLHASLRAIGRKLAGISGTP